MSFLQIENQLTALMNAIWEDWKEVNTVPVLKLGSMRELQLADLA